MKRLLALDVGNKRIGIAVSDPLNMFSIGLNTINRTPENQCIADLKKVILNYNIEKIIVGYPLNMKGLTTKQTESTLIFTEILKKNLEIEVILQDERLTSSLAEKILISQNISPSKNKGLIDKKAAELILQQYLDSNKVK